MGDHSGHPADHDGLASRIFPRGGVVTAPTPPLPVGTRVHHVRTGVVGTIEIVQGTCRGVRADNGDAWIGSVRLWEVVR